MRTTTLPAILLFAALGTATAQNAAETYPPVPDGAERAEDFAVRVRIPGGAWQTADTYAVKVDRTEGTAHRAEKASMAAFDFRGEAEVEVTSLHGPISEARVRPLSYGIVPHVEGNRLTFRLRTPRNLSVEVNGDIFHNLHLFANPLDASRPSGPAENLLYFGPGLHRLPGDSLFLRSGQRVYVAGGAVVRGRLIVDRACDVHIGGRGIVCPEGRGEGICIRNSRRVSVEGIVTTQCPVGGSDSVLVRNVKTISSYPWGDGLNVFASSHVLLDSVFCRTSDDCTTVYATRKGFRGGCRAVRMRHAVLWADTAHPVMIGLHGDAAKGETIEDLAYEDIDILDHCENQLDYQGCLAINAGDNNTVRNVRFEDIRIEPFRKGRLFDLRLFYNHKYCAAPGRAIEDILFRNVTCCGTGGELSLIAGYDESRRVRNVRFENLRINGTLIHDDMPGKPHWYKTADMARIFVGEHADDITFTLTTGGPDTPEPAPNR